MMLGDSRAQNADWKNKYNLQMLQMYNITLISHRSGEKVVYLK